MKDATEGPEPGVVPATEMTFDDALAELQRVVGELEAGGQPLERSIALYERGVALHERCARLLAEAELTVKQLVQRAGGAVEAVAVEPGPGAADEGAPGGPEPS